MFKLLVSETFKTEAILVLGSVAAKQLQANSQCAFYVNQHGEVELVRILELGLDYIPEGSALQVLLHQYGYTDEQLVHYLRGRTSRLSLAAPLPPAPEKNTNG